MTDLYHDLFLIMDTFQIDKNQAIEVLKVLEMREHTKILKELSEVLTNKGFNINHIKNML